MFFRRRLVALALLFGAALELATRVEALELPPLTGHLAGRYRMPAFAGFPEFAWDADIRVIDGDRRQVEGAAKATGAKLRMLAEVDATGRNGHWRIVEAEFDTARWLAVFAPHLGSSLEGVTAEGLLTVSGEGKIVSGQATGGVKVVWREGAVRNLAQQWALEGVALKGEFAVDSEGLAVSSTTPFELAVGTITTARFGARNLRVRGLLDRAMKVSVREAGVEIAGGNVTIDPFTVALREPVLDVGLRMVRIGLQDLVALVPSGLAMASGRIDGEVRVRWSEADGLQVGVGRIELRDDEPAVVRLAAAPGFLTSRVPARISLLPAWFGPLARWSSPVNPAYADIQAIELGAADLRVRTLTVSLTPEGDERARSAHVRISAAPERPGAVQEVTFEVNVNGPLAAVLKLGMNQPFSVSAR